MNFPAKNIILRAEMVACGSGTLPGGRPRIERVSLDCEAGTVTLLQGAGGCGKNLLLRVLGLLEAPDAGEVFFRDRPTRGLSEADRAALRNHHFGYLFPEPFLLPSLSVLENIAMPLLKISAVSTEEAQARTREVLDFVGLVDATESGIDGLTLFEQHRVALARALVNRPSVLIVENLDASLRDNELAQFAGLIRRSGVEFDAAVILTASDDSDVLPADRLVQIVDGAVDCIPRQVPGEGGVE